jgi:Zn-finger nucleic acid-binding protein
MSEKQGIEIDYCPTCRGVWLDRGELEKIIERSYAPESPTEGPLRGNDQFFNRSHDDHDYYKHDSHGYNKYGRKRNLLSDLFD